MKVINSQFNAAKSLWVVGAVVKGASVRHEGRWFESDLRQRLKMSDSGIKSQISIQLAIYFLSKEATSLCRSKRYGVRVRPAAVEVGPVDEVPSEGHFRTRPRECLSSHHLLHCLLLDTDWVMQSTVFKLAIKRQLFNTLVPRNRCGLRVGPAALAQNWAYGEGLALNNKLNRYRSLHHWNSPLVILYCRFFL